MYILNTKKQKKNKKVIKISNKIQQSCVGRRITIVNYADT